MSSPAPSELPVAEIATADDPRALRLAEIAARPAAIADAITANFDTIRPAAALTIAARRVRLCGVGTSASAALVGEYLLRLVGIDARVSTATPLAYSIVRAGVDDREQVNATGINVDRLFVMVSALASFLAGMAGVVGGAFLTLYPGAEWEILVYALVVVIVGGLGSLEGAMIGALIVGLLDAYGRWLLPEFSYFVLFGPIAVLMLVRPRGLFGREH